MSVYASIPNGSDWHSSRFQPFSTLSLTDGQQGSVGLGLDCGRSQVHGGEGRPILRSHKSFPHAVGPSSYSTIHYQSPLSQVANPDVTKRFQSSARGGETSSDIPATAMVESVYGGSAPTSPASRFTPASAEAGSGDFPDDDEETETTLGDLEDDGVDEGASKTAAERRAEKRKMKRFRLTHNQTRFLMSEFARQAHPDAAQRERLSREIPGLSPRQVQVWFQNRRAKLKRLTSEDRDRMMKSRALPDDFDMTQALHSPFGAVSQPYSTPTASPSSYAATFTDNGMIRPLIIDGLRRQSEDDTISPISISSSFGAFYSPPGSMPTSEMMSPVSPVSERSNQMGHSISQNTSPRNTNPFVRSSSYATAYHSHHHVPRLQLHDRATRTRAESLASPLRSSMSYTGNALDYGESHSLNVNVPTLSSQGEDSRSNSFDTSNPVYSAGLLNNPAQGFQSAALSRARPTVTTFPPGLELRPQYRPYLPLTNYQQLHLPQGFQSAPLVAPQDFQLPHLDAAYHTATINASYTVAYGGSEQYRNPTHQTQGRISEDQPVGEYASGEVFDNRLQQPSQSSVNDIGDCRRNLSPVFSSCRRRSLTHSTGYNNCP